MDAQNHLDYLFKSLQHHPSPYIICEKMALLNGLTYQQSLYLD